MRAVAALLVVLVTMAGAVAAAPGDVRVRYRMTWGGIEIAEVVDTLRFAGDGSYRIDSKAQPTGLAKTFNLPTVDRHSSGRVAADGSLLMESYVESRGDRLRKVTYDRVAGVVEWVNDKDQPGSAKPREAMVLDNLTYIYMPYATGQLVTEGSAMMADGRRLYEFEYARDAQPVTVAGKLGEFAAWRYVRVNYSDNRKRTAWYAPDLRNLPVRARLVNGVNVIEFFLLAVEYDPSATE